MLRYIVRLVREIVPMKYRLPSIDGGESELSVAVQQAVRLLRYKFAGVFKVYIYARAATVFATNFRL